MTKQYDFALCVLLLLIVQLTLLKVSWDINHKLEMDPLDPSAIEQSKREQEIKLVDDFYSHVTDPAKGHTFRNHLLTTRHSESCEFRMRGISKPCSCCAGAMTFQTAEDLTNGIFRPLPPAESPLSKTFSDVSPSTMLGIFNIAQMFGFTSNKAALNASFGSGEGASAEGSRHGNVLWGTNGLISRTLNYWRGGIMSMYSEIVRLRADLIESRRIASEEKLKLKAAEQRINELEAALKRADKHCKTKARLNSVNTTRLNSVNNGTSGLSPEVVHSSSISPEASLALLADILVRFLKLAFVSGVEGAGRLLFSDTAGDPSSDVKNPLTAAWSAGDNFARIPFRASTTELSGSAGESCTCVLSVSLSSSSSPSSSGLTSAAAAASRDLADGTAGRDERLLASELRTRRVSK